MYYLKMNSAFPQSPRNIRLTRLPSDIALGYCHNDAMVECLSGVNEDMILSSDNALYVHFWFPVISQ